MPLRGRHGTEIFVQVFDSKRIYPAQKCGTPSQTAPLRAFGDPCTGLPTNLSTEAVDCRCDLDHIDTARRLHGGTGRRRPRR
jgi:hypothetical protein